MKKLSLALAMILALTAFVGCNTKEPEKTTDGGNNTTTTVAATTTKATTTTTKTPDSKPTESTPDPTDEPGEQVDTLKLAGGKCGDLQLEGYEAQGYYVEEDGKMVSDSGNAMFVVTNDRMASGKLTATFTSLAGSDANDNGIVFGMGENLGDEYEDNFFWEDPSVTPTYYFLFVSDASTLYLAKVADGKAWTVLMNTEGKQIAGYTHGTTITIRVEFDGQGHIQCYANDELMIDYTDANPLTGDRYGIRCEVPGVVYESVIAEHS